MRTFVALNLRRDVRAALHAAVAPLRDALGRDVAWVAESSLHLTLKFLGDRPDAWVERLAVTLGPALQHVAPVDMAIGGVGAFPSLDRPTVLWVGVEANPALALLYQQVENAATALGAGRERRAFHPHVTVGRVRARASVDARALATAAASVAFDAVQRVTTVDVMESLLGPGGARYRVVTAMSLAGRSEER